MQSTGKASGFQQPPEGSRRRRWLRAASLIYLVVALGDFGYHLVNATYVGDQHLGWNDVVVGFQASLFWPVDLGVQLLAR